MLLAGDEMGRSQVGNNNAYCQDTPASWVDWDLDGPRLALLGFTRRLMALRAHHPVFRRRDFFQGRPLYGSSVRDIVWLQPDGSEMTAQAWGHGHARALAVFLSGDGLGDVDAQARPLRDDSFLLLFNAHSEAVSFTLPAGLVAEPGELLVDTRHAQTPAGVPIEPLVPYQLPGRALALFRFARGPTERP